MKRFWLSLFVVSLSVIAGCQEPVVSTPKELKPVEVIIDGDGKFPESMAGTWKANEMSWEFTFEKDGTILEATIAMGSMPIIPGQMKTVPLIEGGEGVYDPGQWTVQYSPTTRELIVNVVMERIRLQVGEQILDGESTDTLMGTISEDGKTWTADWHSFPRYTAYTPDPMPLINKDKFNPQATLIFTKVE